MRGFFALYADRSKLQLPALNLLEKASPRNFAGQSFIKVCDSSNKGFFKSVCTFNSSLELWNSLILRVLSRGFTFHRAPKERFLEKTPS